MSDQIHIRDPETAARVRLLAKSTGRTLSDVVREAVKQIDPARLKKASAFDFEASVRRDHERLIDNGFEIDDLYDPATGLPK